MTPPRGALRLLQTRLHPDERDELIGDLQEQFAAKAATIGPAAARRWYWRQALALAWGFSLRQRDVVSTEHQRVRGRFAWDLLRTDFRHARRSLWRTKSFTITAWLTLTLGIGLSTAVFSLVRGVLIDPLPYPHADRLVRLSEQRSEGMMKNDTGVLSDVGIGAWSSMPSAISDLAPYGSYHVTAVLPGHSENLSVADVGRDFFKVIGTTPVAGRLLQSSDAEPSSQRSVVVTERFAQRAFGSAQAALGQLMNVEYNCIVVGVVPDTFRFPDGEVEIWRAATQFRRFPAPGEVRQMSYRTEVVALLREGSTIEQAQASGAAVSEMLAAASEASGSTPIRATFHVRRLLDEIVSPIRSALLILSTGTIIVLAAACVSLANLLVARNTSRQREVAVRLALGAGRWRVGRPVLLELLTLSAMGALGSGVLAWWLLRALPAIAPAGLPRIESIQFDARALAFALAASVVTVLMAGWLPVWRLSSVSVREISGSDNRVRVGGSTGSADRVRSLLAGAQVAFAVLLLTASLLIGHSLFALLHVNLGYQPSGVLGFRAAQPLSVRLDAGRLTNYYHALVDRIAATPGVISVGQASSLPMQPVGQRSGVSIVGRPIEGIPSQEDLAALQYISTDYLRTLRTRVIAGRGFTAGDVRTSEKVALVDEVLAKRYFPQGDAIGHQLRQGIVTATIVGVVEAIRSTSPGELPTPVIYLPTDQAVEFLSFMHTSVAIRTAGDPAALANVVRQAARELDPNVPLFDVHPLTADLGVKVAGPRFFTIVLSLFAALALSTALLGIYGVLAFAVERRKLEFGIRRALGATEGHVTALVMRRAVVFAVFGLAVGLTGAAIGARLLRTQLFGITPADPVSFAGAAVLVLAVVFAASWQPVRRALRIDPARALRVD